MTPPNLPHYLKLPFPFFIGQKTSIFIRSIILFLHDLTAMHYELLLEHIRKHISLDKDEEGQIIALLKHKRLKKKQFLLHEGDVQRQRAFVIAGCLRSYSIDKNGFEHVLQFAPAGWWIGDMRSYITQEPGILNIDAIDDTELLLLSKEATDQLFNSIPKLERLFRILTENSLATYQQRLIDNLSLPAVERYNNFCRLYPSLIQLLPQKQIASYIGVTPEFLSKMLRQQTEK